MPLKIGCFVLRLSQHLPMMQIAHIFLYDAYISYKIHILHTSNSLIAGRFEGGP